MLLYLLILTYFVLVNKLQAYEPNFSGVKILEGSLIMFREKIE
jgi:hypothetical protein